MGKRTAFSLPGFVRLAPSIHAQDPQASAAGYQTRADTFFASSSSSSQSSYSLPPDFVPELVYPSSSSSSFSGGPSGRRKPYPLSGQSSFVLPPDTASSRGTAPPDLIVITSWTGAAARHVAKYTDAYNKLYPGVPVLVITTVVADLVLHSERHKLRALQPAVDYLLSTVSSDYEPTPRLRFRSLLLHAFSEGGAHKAVLLAKAYLNHTTALHHHTHTHTHHTNPYNNTNLHNTSPAAGRQGRKLPVSALLLDSTPGRPSYRRATTGFSRSLPHPSHPLTRALGPPLAASVIGAIWVGQRLKGKFASEGSLIEETRRALNDGALWDLRRCARTYLFGVGDEVVGWRDVEDHALESAELCSFSGSEPGSSSSSSVAGGESGRSSRAGSPSREGGEGEEVVTGGPAGGYLMVKFRGTEHCAHAKGEGNGEVYWAAVRKTWEMRADGGLGLRLGLGRRLSLDSLCGGGEGEERGMAVGGW